MATKTHHRVFAFVMALLFFATAVASGVAVVLQIRADNKQAQASKQLQDQSSSSNGAVQDSNNQPQEGKLEGTKLANFTPGSKVESVQIIDLKEGTGEPVKAGATVTAHYTGALVSDGTIFQSSKDTGQPFTASLNQLIQGWQEGIPGMKAGGVRRLIIPAAKAYGSQSQPGIPANSDLVFDIELISIQ